MRRQSDKSKLRALCKTIDLDFPKISMPLKTNKCLGTILDERRIKGQDN